MARTFQLWVTVVSWHDGDTFHGVLDQALWTYRGRLDKPERIRCALIQAPEVGDPGGAEATAYARALAPPGDYRCISYKPDPDTYGRPLLDLILSDNRMFSAVMLAAGHARPYKP